MLTKRSILIFLSFITMLFITIFSAAISWARYEKRLPPDIGDMYRDIEVYFTNNEEVSTPDEFWAAVINGNANIKLSDSLEGPLVVSSGIADVRNDLTIDLNGHEIQRNNRDPILRINDGVSVTITDSSDDCSGSLYNPVGSVLEVNGGQLSVSNGKVESGPRKTEYIAPEGVASPQVYGTNSLTNTTEHGIIGDVLPVAVNFYTLNSSTNHYDYELRSDLRSITPYITDKIVDGSPLYYIDGNVYINSDLTSYADYLTADTYLYYTIKDPTVAINIANVSTSPSFYYEYNVKKITTGAEPYYIPTNEDIEYEDVFAAIVFGFRNDKSTAETEGYAAVRMNSGDIIVDGGKYYSWFGKDATSSVMATGGTIIINDGLFESIEDSDCIKFIYRQTRNVEFVQVNGGYFKSALGNTITVESGIVYVNGGTYVQDCRANLAVSEYGENGASINITGGELEVEGTASNKVKFVLIGSGSCGIITEAQNTSSSEHVSINYADFGGAALLSDEEKAIFGYSGAGEVSSTERSNFMLNSGISIVSGDVTIENSTFSFFSRLSAGIHSPNLAGADFDLLVKNCNFNIEDTLNYNAYGINLNTTSNSTVEICDSVIETNGYGIRQTGGQLIFSSEDTTTYANGDADNKLICSKGLPIYVNGGTLIVRAGSKFKIESELDLEFITKRLADGSFTNGSELSIMEIVNGSLTIEGEYGMNLSTNTITYEGNDNGMLEISSYFKRNNAVVDFLRRSENFKNATTLSNFDTNIVSPFNAIGDYNTIKVTNGNVNIGGELKIKSDALPNNTTRRESWTYWYNEATRSHAINIVGGNFRAVNKLDLDIDVGEGISVNGGNVIIGHNAIGSYAASSATDLKVILNGDRTEVPTKVDGAWTKWWFYTGYTKSSLWKTLKSVTGGSALSLNNGSLTVYNGQFNAAYGNGISVKVERDSTNTALPASRRGNVEIFNGNFRNGFGKLIEMFWDATGYGGSETYRTLGLSPSGPGIYAALSVYGDADVTIHNGKFDGACGALISGYTRAIVTDTTKGIVNGSVRDGNAIVTIEKGTFGEDTNLVSYKLKNGTSHSSNTHPIDGFPIYDHATVIFGTTSGSAANVKVYGENTGIVCNSYVPGGEINLGAVSQTVNVYCGTYIAKTSFLVYNKATIVNVYNYNKSAKLIARNTSETAFDGYMTSSDTYGVRKAT